jgi:hypothetical protein
MSDWRVAMWHVDEGILHAYLDDRGAGSGERGADEQGAGSGERAAETTLEIEAHLASCAQCQALLEEVKRVRERAGEILAASSPADLVAPPFEEIRARAQARDMGSRVLRLTRVRRLAWAATVMLAVAVGWYARGTVFPGSNEQMSAPQPATVADEMEEGAGSGERTTGGVERGAEIARREAEEVAPTVMAAELDRAVEPADRDVAGRAAAADEREKAAATPPAEAAARSRAQAEPDVEVKLEQLVDVSGARRQRLDSPDRLAGQAPQVVVQQVAADEPAAPVGGIALGEVLMFEDSLWVAASEADARDALGGDIPVVQDLPVMDYWVSLMRGRNVVRVRQRLDDANVLEVIVSRVVSDVRAGMARGVVAAPAANEAQAEVEDSLKAVAVRSGVYRIILRGPVSADSLRVLGEKVK